MPDEKLVAAAAKGFHAAALGQKSWAQAVEGYAGALNIAHGQLVAFGEDSLVALNVLTGIAPEAVAEIERIDGHNPELNSRVRLGMAAPELEFLDEADFTTEQDMAASREYRDWMLRNSIGYSCVTPLLRANGMLVGLGALRTRSQNEMTGEEKRAFMAVAANARSAVNLSIALERRSASNLVAALEGMATAAIIFDPAGKVVAMSPGAERALADGRLGRVVDRVFVPNRPEERDRFDKSMRRALRARRETAVHPPRPMALTMPEGERLIIEFAPLPQDSGLDFTAAVMVILRGGKPALRGAEIARELFDLTPTETGVAALLLEGRSPNDIAAERGTSVGTVRNHVHRILSKSRCSSQVEFLATIGRFSN